MIDLYDQYEIDDATRKMVFDRAYRTYPYLYLFKFHDEVPSKKDNIFTQNVGINRDFYLTEIMAGQLDTGEGDVFPFDISVYTAYNESLYNFIASQKLPGDFIVTKARLDAAPSDVNPIIQQLDDKQWEYLPRLIRSNDKIYIDFRNQSDVDSAFNINMVVKGFSILEDAWLTPIEINQVNNSLNSPVEWLEFETDIPDVFGKNQTNIIETDNKPRLLLGFGVKNYTPDDITDASQITINLTDLSRQLRLCDNGLPLEFLAPRMPIVADTHIYYLPIEYYLQPYTKLQFNFDNFRAQRTASGAQIIALTRTI